METLEKGIQLRVSDVTQQKVADVDGVLPESTVRELVENLLDELRLSHHDTAGRPITYQAMLQREGRHLHGSERIGDAVRPGDSLVLQPSIDAA